MENDPAAIREEIEVTRERLADTAEAIAYKADVPARVKEDVAQRIDTAKETATDVAASVASTVADVTQHTISNVQDFTQTAKTSFSDASSVALDNALIASGAAADLVATTREAAAPYVEPIVEKTRSLAGAGGSFAKNPLALAIGAVAIGFMIGLILPVSKVEPD